MDRTSLWSGINLTNGQSVSISLKLKQRFSGVCTNPIGQVNLNASATNGSVTGNATPITLSCINTRSSTDFISNTKVDLFPNPTTQNLGIFTHDGVFQAVELQTISGVVKKVQKFQRGISTLQIDVSDLPAGLYLIKFYSTETNHQFEIKKFVKN